MPIEDYPYHVAIEYNNKLRCVGAIISANYVVTAASCVSGNINSLKIRSGTSFRESKGTLHNIKKAIVHEKFNRKLKVSPNNIALIRIEKPFKFNKVRQAIKLPIIREKLFQTLYYFVTGWGHRRKGLSSKLLASRIFIKSKERCSSFFEENFISEDHFCAHLYLLSKKPRNVDIGGPLQVRGELLGIVIHVEFIEEKYEPSILTSVTYHRNWIKEKTSI